MNEKESYIKQLRQLILEDDNLAYGESLEEAIYRIIDLEELGYQTLPLDDNHIVGFK